jgi:hypothetical protein
MSTAILGTPLLAPYPGYPTASLPTSGGRPGRNLQIDLEATTNSTMEMALIAEDTRRFGKGGS